MLRCRAWRGWKVVALVAALAATDARVALAQDVSSGADDAATRDAKTRFEEGLKRYEAGDFEGARVAFQQAYSVLHAVDILYNLALSELRSNRPVEALHHLQEYLKDKRPTEEERAKASKYLAEAHSKTGHVFVEAPGGAVVLFDDVPLDKKAPIRDPVDVSAGKHVCAVRLPEKTQTVEVIAQPGQSVTVRFGGDAPVVTEGDRRGEGATPGGETGGGGWGTGKTVTVIALGGAAVLSVVGGVVFAADQSSKSDAAAKLRSDNPGLNCSVTPGNSACGGLKDAKDGYDRDKTLSAVFFIAGGVFAGAAIATAVIWPNKDATPRQGVRVVPSVGPTGMSMAISGTF